MTKAHEFAALGQSIWYDNIRRAILESGEMQQMIDAGVLGMTSNPTIFEKAIGGSSDYDAEMRRLAAEGKTTEEIYETLTVGDIRRAADLLQPVYEATNGVDGYISLEVSPTLAHNTTGTIQDAKRLYNLVGRPNVMIKVPATPAGIPAVEALIGVGINVNVTLIFSLAAYQAVMEAYLRGLEHFAASGGDLRRVASVASFFVSRVDSAVDKILETKGEKSLLGKAAVANAKAAYAQFHKTFGAERWAKLHAAGARVQRPLWASTGTKNPAYSDVLYVDELIGPDTVNTVPPATLDALLDHGTPKRTLDQNLDEAYAVLERLKELGIDMSQVTQKLLDDGVEAFLKSFESLMDTISRKREQMITALQGRSAILGGYEPSVAHYLTALEKHNIPARIWLKDHTVWRSEPAEISNRLGWLDSPNSMKGLLDEIHDVADEIWADGLTKALVLGMGGSSLAPEVFSKTFGVSTAHLELGILDSTDPDAVQTAARQFPPEDTVYVVSSKSGGTVEMASFFKYLYNLTARTFGIENKAQIGRHFIAITDPGSGLAETARKHLFRHIFLNDANIGGRYSALSCFGLVPAALDGVDLHKLLDRAALMAERCGAAIPAGDNPGAWLGTIMGALALAGRDKLTLICSPQIESFGDWVEQLIAESTGKEGKGILPVVGEPVGAPEVYGPDRLFVYLHLEGDSTYHESVTALEKAGHPVVRLHLEDLYDLGGQYFMWEFATAVAGHILNIQPFDQPNVESAKVLARQVVKTYQETGTLPAQKPLLTDGEISVYSTLEASDAPAAFQTFKDMVKPGDYLSLQAYLNPADPQIRGALRELRDALRDHTRLAVTLGFGPRFLHSTGQLHKGDGGKGLFVIFTADPVEDAPIPDEAGASASAMSFGVLKMAQALGDQQALIDNGRRVIRFHLGKKPAESLRKLISAVK